MEGWLFDIYPAPQGGMIVWLITRRGEAVRLLDPWRPSIYVLAKTSSNLPPFLTNGGLEIEHAVDYKYVNPSDFERAKVLRLTFQRSGDIKSFLQRIDPISLISAKLFNVDVPVAQLYLYDMNLFPLAFVRAHVTGAGIGWELLDDADSCQYEVPPLKGASISIRIKKSGKTPAFGDPIEAVTVEASGVASEIEGGAEADKLLELARLVKEVDPDIILTKNGDSFLFPYLIRRAFQNQGIITADL